MTAPIHLPKSQVEAGEILLAFLKNVHNASHSGGILYFCEKSNVLKYL